MDQNESTDYAVTKLFKIIDELAKDPTDLINMFTSGTACANDLEDLAEDLHMYFSGFTPAELGQVVYDSILLINKLLEKNSGDVNLKFWTLDGLNSEQDWFEVRKIARACKPAISDLLNE